MRKFQVHYYRINVRAMYKLKYASSLLSHQSKIITGIIELCNSKRNFFWELKYYTYNCYIKRKKGIVRYFIRVFRAYTIFVLFL